MARRYPIELRERVVANVEAGATHRATAAQFAVSIKFVNDMVKLKRETGCLHHRRLGSPAPGKLAPYIDWLRERVTANGDITLDELAAELASEQGLKVDRSAIWKRLRQLGLSHKKNAVRA